MKGRNLLAILICVIVLAGGLGYYSLLPREIPVQTTRTESTTHPPLERTTELRITIISDTLLAQFPTAINVTSLIQNTRSRNIDSLSILQTIPEGLNLTGVYLVKANGSRSLYDPSITSGRLSYPLNNTLAPGEKIAIIVLLESTPAAVSGNFTTIARGTYDGNWVQSQGIAWISVQPAQSTCQDWGAIDFGDFRLFSNVWGGEKEAHLQCMAVGPGAFGWNLSRLSPSINELYQVIQPYYPEVIYGKNPWHTVSTTTSLPAALDSLKTLEVSLTVSMKQYTKYNLAFDIWITNNTESSPTQITDEIMVWLVWTPGQAGEYVADTLNDGYNIYQHRTYKDWNMIMTGAQEQHRYHQFTIGKQGVPAKINLLAFFDHLRREKHDLRYLASIELGNEVWSGVGGTSITKLRVDLKTTRNLESAIAPREADAPVREWMIIGTVDRSIIEDRSWFVRSTSECLQVDFSSSTWHSKTSNYLAARMYLLNGALATRLDGCFRSTTVVDVKIQVQNIHLNVTSLMIHMGVSRAM